MRSWSWLHNLVVPALIAAIEATWASAWLEALARVSPRTPADVPYLAVALPVVAAVVLSSVASRYVTTWWRRALLLVPIAFVGVAVSAGIIGAANLHSSFAAVSSHPWSITGQTPSAEASLAWFIATVTWVRGVWLGWRELSTTHAARAVGVSGLAFLIFFVVGAIHGSEASFHTHLRASVVRLLVAFPEAIAVIALTKEREIERDALHHQRSRPDIAWLGAVVVPMVAVAGVATLLALAVGPFAPQVEHFVTWVARGIGAVIGAFARWLAHFFHKAKLHPGAVLGRQPVRGLPLRATQVQVPAWVWLISIVVSVAVGAVVLFFFLRALWRMRPERKEKPERVSQVNEEKDSVFSWRHLLAQLLDALRRLFMRKRNVAVEAVAPVVVVADRPAPESVREHYRSVLRAARAGGNGRAAPETPSEFKQRLLGIAPQPPEQALASLTVAYETVRYGDEEESGDVAERAKRAAEALVSALQEPPVE